MRLGPRYAYQYFLVGGSVAVGSSRKRSWMILEIARNIAKIVDECLKMLKCKRMAEKHQNRQKIAIWFVMRLGNALRSMFRPSFLTFLMSCGVKKKSPQCESIAIYRDMIDRYCDTINSYDDSPICVCLHNYVVK